MVTELGKMHSFFSHCKYRHT